MSSPEDSTSGYKASTGEVDRYRRVRSLFEQLIPLAQAEREELLERERQRDPKVAEEVGELLALEGEGTLDLQAGILEQAEARTVQDTDGRSNDVEPTVELPSHVGRYEIRGLLGRGGMGSVYRAWDASLEREVALKILPQDVAISPDRLERFEREAKTLATLQHAGVVTIFSVEQAEGTHFFTMELVEGRSLAERIPKGRGLNLEQFFTWTHALVDALAAAHEASIVHRDLKPANILVSEPGDEIRLVDFGLVKRVAKAGETQEKETATGLVMGTWSYMSPEQAKGQPVDQRTDVFSLGVVLYEMLTGSRPFQRSTATETVAATLHEEHSSLRALRPSVPKKLAAIINRCLEKDPNDRFQNASEVREAIETISASKSRSLVRLTMAAAAVSIVVLGFALADWQSSRAEQRMEARLEKIETLQSDRRYWDAFLEAQSLLESDPTNESGQRLLDELSIKSKIDTDPPGAEISVRIFDQPESEWISLGKTPIEDALIPNDVLVLRAEMPGRATSEIQYAPRRGAIQVALQAAEDAPEGMVYIPEGRVALWQLPPVPVPGFWMDRTEVSNAEYESFVRAGGYEQAEFWPEDLLYEGEALEFAEVRRHFVDQTGRPGPSTWSAGTFPADEADFPVRGVSWYEATAFAKFTGRALPTIYHWRHATPGRPSNHMARRSNFNSDGPVAVASAGAISPTGIHDLSGNVDEWVVNSVGQQRYVLGGSWRDPRYSFGQEVRRSPWERGETLGFRRVLLVDEPDPALAQSLDLERLDFSNIRPVSDEVYEAFKANYEADPVELDERLESSDDSSPYWTRQRVSFTASYGGERIPAHLFLPRQAAPPYQAVVYFPSASAFAFPNSDQLADLPIVDFIPRSGRAFLVPVLKGLYERREPLRGPNDIRRRLTEMTQDIIRAVDYLEARADIDDDKIAFASISLGSTFGPLALALEPRFRAAVLIAGGFSDDGLLSYPAAVQPWNYAPRATTPTLMINGRGDHLVPVETGQRPMFEMLGAPPSDKRHVVLEGGSLPDDQHAIAKEALDWLDRYLGPVAFANS